MADEPFQICNITGIEPDAPEPMGTKDKFWLRHKTLGLCLFKEARANTGEDWAEKAAEICCELLGLPHAQVELAVFGERRGILTPFCLPDNSALIHGNEILAHFDEKYPKGGRSSRQFSQIPQHTVGRVVEVLGNKAVQLPTEWDAPEQIRSAIGVFIGYLLLDAWIGNTDRHHENWGLVLKIHANPHDASAQEKNPPTLHIAPTFDHASSLGRNESDARRRDRLVTRDRGFSIESYVERSRSKLYANEEDSQALTTLDAFLAAARHSPQEATMWVRRLSEICLEDTLHQLRRIPSKRISEAALDFAQRMLELNQERIVKSWITD